MRGTLKVDHNKKKIIMNATYEKYSRICSSDEFANLMSVKSIFPTYEVVTKRAKTNPDSNRHKGLNYDFMKWYIRTYSSEEVAKENIAKIDAAQALSTRQDGTYGKVKSWFLDKYSELKDKNIAEDFRNLYNDSIWGAASVKPEDEKTTNTCETAEDTNLVEIAA